MIHDLFAALSRARLAAGAGTLLLALFARPTYGFHLDVVVGASGGTLTAGFCAAAAAGCDGLAVITEIGLPPGTIPLHGATGQPIFVTDFGDFAGGPFATDNPGFFAGAGALPANLLLRYEITGFLQYWDPALATWGRATPNGERIRLAGGFAAEAGGSCGLLVCFTPGSTVITTTGVSGAPSLIIDQTAANGSLHTHLDWFLELPSGTRAGAAGAYLLELRMARRSHGAFESAGGAVQPGADQHGVRFRLARSHQRHAADDARGWRGRDLPRRQPAPTIGLALRRRRTRRRRKRAVHPRHGRIDWQRYGRSGHQPPARRVHR